MRAPSQTPRRAATLAALLEERGCDALLCAARSSRDPDLAPFVGAVHLGASLLGLEYAEVT